MQFENLLSEEFLAIVVVAAILAGLGYFLLDRIFHSRAAKTWPLVDATIVSSRLETIYHNEPNTHFLVIAGDAERHSSGVYPYYGAAVSFEYQVDGQTYTSNKIATFDSVYHRKEDKAQAVLDLFPFGGSFKAHVNPEDPADAMLQSLKPAVRRSFNLMATIISGITRILPSSKKSTSAN